MNSERPDSNRAGDRRRTGERSIVLLMIGCLLLTPPLADIFQLDWRIFGIPFTALYLFGVWAALIAATAVLSRHQQRHADWDSQESGARDETENAD